jgi:methionyl-tRNA formyltransferase
LRPKIIVIGGIESTYKNAQILHDLGAKIVMFFTRGENSPGWEGVDRVDESKFVFSKQVPRTEVKGDINEHTHLMKKLKPDFIFSLGWQQIFKKQLLSLCPVIGIHESLLPEGAGAVPIANAIFHDQPVTGVTLFQLDEGMDTGPIIAQLRGGLDPRKVNATDLYREAMRLEARILKMYYPLLVKGLAPRISQDFSRRTVYGKIQWNRWPESKRRRVRVAPYA